MSEYILDLWFIQVPLLYVIWIIEMIVFAILFLWRMRRVTPTRPRTQPAQPMVQQVPAQPQMVYATLPDGRKIAVPMETVVTQTTQPSNYARTVSKGVPLEPSKTPPPTKQYKGAPTTSGVTESLSLEDREAIVLTQLEKFEHIGHTALRTMLHWSSTTLTKVIDSMIVKGYPVEVVEGDSSSKGGRKPKLYQLKRTE